MIASLRGTLSHKDAQGVVVDCNGVGYGLAMSLSGLAALGDVGTEISLVVHTHVTQDSLRLYGFAEAAERDLFTSLIGASGVGPKLALAVLSTFSPGELSDVVARGDVSTLVRIPGVGKKKAERLVLELKDRLPTVVGSALSPRYSSTEQDLTSALENLGFTGQIAARAARDAVESNPEKDDLAFLVREALRATTRI